MNPRDIKNYPIVWTDDQSQPIFVGDFRDVVITIEGTGVVNVLASAQREVPDFTSPSTITNSYVSVVIADMGVANTYATTLTAAGDTKMGEVNTNLITWICLERSANTVDAIVTLCDNS